MSTFAIFGSSFDEIKAAMIRRSGLSGFKLLRNAWYRFQRARSIQLSPMYDNPAVALEFKARCMEKAERYKYLKLRARVRVKPEDLGNRRRSATKPAYCWKDVDEQSFQILDQIQE